MKWFSWKPALLMRFSSGKQVYLNVLCIPLNFQLYMNSTLYRKGSSDWGAGLPHQAVLSIYDVGCMETDIWHHARHQVSEMSRECVQRWLHARAVVTRIFLSTCWQWPRGQELCIHDEDRKIWPGVAMVTTTVTLNAVVVRFIQTAMEGDQPTGG